MGCSTKRCGIDIFNEEEFQAKMKPNINNTELKMEINNINENISQEIKNLKENKNNINERFASRLSSPPRRPTCCCSSVTEELTYNINIFNEKYKKPILVGLNNIGANCCYMNATLQCLSNTKKLTEYFFHDFKYDSKNKTMTNEYYKVIKNLWNRENNNKSYSPYSFKKILSQENPLFVGNQDNNSKDLINFLLERFHQELNIININHEVIYQIPEDQTDEKKMFNAFIIEVRQKFNSPIYNLFCGFLETKTKCLECKIEKYNFQLYTFLDFPLEQIDNFLNNKDKKPVNLYECFEYNRKIDLMDGENQMFCDQCNKLCDSTYTSLIYSAPNYLIINLNRGKGTIYKSKVIFPEQLNILNYVTSTDKTVYELYAVIGHLGPTSVIGHFVAYCKNCVDHKWYLYNDAFVTLCTKPQQYNDVDFPCVLFYKAVLDGF